MPRKANENESTILDKLRGDPRVHCGMSGGAYDLLIAERSATWPACIGWARRKFESYFTQTLTNLLTLPLTLTLTLTLTPTLTLTR